ncbi:MAG: zf-HC2 domain-containing protein [Acidobacteriota bacterium]
MTMTCRDARDLADAYLADEMSVETRHDIERHLEACPECRAEFEHGRALRGSVRRAFLGNAYLQSSPDLTASIARTLRPASGTARPSTAWRYRWATAAAAVILVSAAAVGVAMSMDTAQLLSLARAAWGDHRNCAVAFRLAQKPLSLEEASWSFDASFARLQTTPGAVIVTAGGDALVTERHSCEFGGRRYAHIVLKFKGELVSLLIADEETSHGENVLRAMTMPGLHVRVLSVDGEQAAVFRAADHLGIVVGHLSETDLRQLTAALAAPVASALAG